MRKKYEKLKKRRKKNKYTTRILQHDRLFEKSAHEPHSWPAEQQQIGSHTHLQLHYTRITISINDSIAIEYKTGNTRFMLHSTHKIYKVENKTYNTV